MKKKIIASAIILSALAAVMALWISSLHYPYVATEDKDKLTIKYKGEPYVYIGDEYAAREIVGKDIVFEKTLGEIKPSEFYLEDYLLRNYPIHSIKGDEELNFIAKPCTKSPTRIYCKKSFLNLQ